MGDVYNNTSREPGAVYTMIDIQHEIKIRAPQQKVFNAISTLEGLRCWHSAKIDGGPKVGDTLRFESVSNPIFRWQVAELDAPKRLQWKCAEGPGDSVGTSVVFNLNETSDGRTQVELAHSGWSGTHGNYRKCNTLWAILLHHLRMYAETDTANPAYR